MRRRPSGTAWLCLGAMLVLGGCGSSHAASPPSTARPPVSATPSSDATTTTAPRSTTTVVRTTTTSTRPRTTTTSSSTSTSTSTTSTSTTGVATTPATTTPVTVAPDPTEPGPDSPSPVGPPVIAPPPALPATPPVDAGELPTVNAAFESLLDGNFAVSVTVLRDGSSVFARAAGTTLGGGQMTPDSPMVLASVSKLITAITVARLVEDGRLLLDAPVPWSAMGLAHDPGWDTVTVRELLTHTSGMPVARDSWLNEPGSCAIPLQAAMSQPPRAHRGTWVYSNGNYCALGLLISEVAGEGIDAAANELVFGPLAAGDAHLTTVAAEATDAPYVQGVGRLERLGAAGTWMASTNVLAVMLAAVSLDDMFTLGSPGIMTDQYGWGHTGTVDGAKACAWTMEGGRSVVVAVVAGNRPSSGGRVCDLIVPALAADLGIWNGEPDRFPK